jgi:hypothetical protein
VHGDRRSRLNTELAGRAFDNVGIFGRQLVDCSDSAVLYYTELVQGLALCRSGAPILTVITVNHCFFVEDKIVENYLYDFENTRGLETSNINWAKFPIK